MGTKLQKTGRFSAWVVVALVAIVGLVVLVLQTRFAKDYIRQKAVQQINSGLAGEVEVGRLNGTLLFNLELQNLRVTDGRENLMARADRVSATYSPLALIWGQLNLNEVVVERPNVVIRRYEDQVLNVATLSKPAPEPPPSGPSSFEVVLESIEINDGAVLWEDRTANPPEKLDGLIAQILRRVGDKRGEAIRDFKVAVAGSTQAPATSVPALAGLTDLDLQGNFGMYGSEDLRGGVEALTTAITASSLPRTETLKIDGFDGGWQPALTKGALEELSLSGVTRLAEVEGRASFQTHQNELGNTLVDGLEGYSGRIGELSVGKRHLALFLPDQNPRSDISASVEVAGRPEWATVEAAITAQAGGSVQIWGTADLEDPADPGWQSVLRIRDLDTAEIIDIPGQPIRANGDLWVQGRGTQLGDMEADGKVALWETAWGPWKVDRVATAAGIDGATYRVEDLVLRTPYLDGRAHGFFEGGGDFEVHLNVDTENASERPPNSGPVDLEDGVLRVDGAGKLNLKADSPSGYIGRMDIDADWDISSFRAPGLEIDGTAGSLRAEVAPPDGRGDGQADRQADGSAGRSRMSLKLDGSARGVRSPGLRLRRAVVQLDGTARSGLSADSPLALFEALELDGDIKVEGLNGAGAKLRSGSINLALDRGSSRPRFDYDLDGDLLDLDLFDIRVDRLDSDLDGYILLNEDAKDKTPAFERFRARGKLRVQQPALPGLTSDEIRARLDIGGTPDDLDGTARVKLDTLEAGGLSFPAASLSLDAKSGRNLQITARASPKQTPDRPFTLAFTGSHSPDYLAYTFRDLRLGRGDVDWSLQEPAGLDLSGGAVAVDSLMLNSNGQTILLDGVYRSSGRQNLDVHIDKLRLREIHRLLDIFGVPEVAGLFGADLTLRGTARSPDIELEAAGRELLLGGQGPWRFDLKTNYRPDRLEIAKAEVGAGTRMLAEIRGSIPLVFGLDGRFDLLWRRDAELTVQVPTIALSKILEELKAGEMQTVDGKLQSTLSVSGPMARPKVNLNFEADQMAVRGALAGQTIDIEDLGTTARLEIDPNASRDRLVLFGRTTWRGEEIMKLDMKSSAPIARWLEDIEKGRPDINWSDRILRQTFDLEVVLDETDLEQVPLASFQRENAEGKVSAKIDLNGSVLSPKGELKLDVDDFGWDIFRDIYVDVSTEFDDDRVKIERFAVEWDAQELFWAAGTLPLPVEHFIEGKPVPELPVDFAMQVKPVPVAKFGAFDYTFTRLQGQVAAYLTIDGTLSDPKVEGRAAVTNVNIAERPNSTVAFEFGADDNLVNAKATICRGSETILAAKSRLPIVTDVTALAAGTSPLAEGEVYGYLRGDSVPMSHLVPQILLDDIIRDVQGTLDADVVVQGRWEQLRPSGKLEITDGAITLVEFGRRLRDIQLLTRVEQEQMTVERLSFEGASGEVSASGTATLAGVIPETYKFDLRANEFDISGFGTSMNALVTAEAEAYGEVRPPTYQLNVDTEELNVELPAAQESNTWQTSLSEDIIIIDPRTGGKEPGQIDPALARTTAATEETEIEVRLRLSRDSWVRHPSGYVNFDGNIGVEMYGETMWMSGQINSYRGEFEFLGTQFKVPQKAGVVRFTGATPPNPILDVEAYHPLDRSIVADMGQPASGDPQIMVHVQGRALEPQLDLTSDPGMSETDIIFVLMTGRPPSNAGVGQDEGVASQAVAAASGIFSGLLQQKLKGSLPVDVLRIETGQQGFQDSRIRVGKYITKDIFVSYAYKFGAGDEEAGYEARIEYHFLPRWMIEARYGQNNTGELNVFWDVY